MAVPVITALKMWAGTLFTKDDWDFNFSKIVSWLADGDSDIVVNTLKTTNGIDLDGAQISNLGAATTGDQAVNYDQALTLLNRTSYYYPYSIASGKVNASGKASYLQKDSNTQVTVLAGNTNPDLVCIMSDGTVETVTSNTVLTVPATNGIYLIVKEKGQPITIGSVPATVHIGYTKPSSPTVGMYYCDCSVVPFQGWKYTGNGWEEVDFCYLGHVTVSSGTATTYIDYNYNDNRFDVNINNISLVDNVRNIDYTSGVSVTLPTSGAKYTAPYDGIYITSVYKNNSYCHLFINNTETSYYYKDNADGSTHVCFYVPLSKGDIIYWGTSLNTDSSKFYKYKA